MTTRVQNILTYRKHGIVRRFDSSGTVVFFRLKYVVTCVLCRTRKTSTFDEACVLQAVPPSSTAFQKVSIDLTGPVPWSHDRYRHTVVVVDHYSKYVITRPQRGKKLVKFRTCSFVDNTDVFDAKINCVWVRKWRLGIKHIHTSPIISSLTLTWN